MKWRSTTDRGLRGSCRPASARPARSLVAIVVGVLLTTTAACGRAGQVDEAIDVAKDTAAKAGVLAISVGIESYHAQNATFPASAGSDVLGVFVTPWPVNPFTGEPMGPGDQPGDYTYTTDGSGYRLVGHLSAGGEYVRPAE